MTRAPDVTRLRFRDAAEAISEMRRRGLRASTSRRLVLDALYAADGPCAAEHLARSLDLDVASVHRNLDVFERHGLVQHVHLGHGPGLYALVGAGEHEYLYCESCGAVRALAPAELDHLRSWLTDRFGHRARFTHHAIVGTCRDCADIGAAPADAHVHEHSHGDFVHSHADPHERGRGHAQVHGDG
jgi:Fur family transcriptional regulator, ferric uptake regulator